ncbi:MBL fold metallo-hydrolase [Aliamphritea spongicola]|uniref:MBL fold metallo-hydrolase n=1 Tax=Aliamphritea spongicola TaxID=707589 RepID=UPI00196B39AA|nr:3',5'-cyclic-nucleotide phosphodiesterase [Aliamphritea spongicola]MBN3560963.1 3',5'-cyclic-nucleotide phosphodiesterase [Aliamphritea spongicola]
MKLDILGCSGGIGKGLKTTTFLVDDTLLLDAGTGVESLTLEQMLQIRTVLITHAHVDHITGLPLMLATIFDQHQAPIDVYALPEVIDALQTHIFNWVIWPDYTCLPEANPILRLHTLSVGDTLQLENKSVEVLPAEHPTPTVGYLLSNATTSFAFSGDNGINEQLWPILSDRRPDLLIIDVSFTDDVDELARLSGHLTPSHLAEELSHFSHDCPIMITHLKPGFESEIMERCQTLLPNRNIRRLVHGSLQLPLR